MNQAVELIHPFRHLEPGSMFSTPVRFSLVFIKQAWLDFLSDLSSYGLLYLSLWRTMLQPSVVILCKMLQKYWPNSKVGDVISAKEKKNKKIDRYFNKTKIQPTVQQSHMVSPSCSPLLQAGTVKNRWPFLFLFVMELALFSTTVL